MKIIYDKKADAAYIYFTNKIEPGWVAKTYPCDSKEVNGMINLDFDFEGKLGGIEVINANKKLPKELLDQASR